MEQQIEKIAKIICKAIQYGNCCEREDGTACLRNPQICESANHYSQQILSAIQPVIELPKMPLLEFTQEQILGLIPAQAIVDYDRAKEVLSKVAITQRNLCIEACQSALSNAKTVTEVEQALLERLAKQGYGKMVRFKTGDPSYAERFEPLDPEKYLKEG